MANTFGFTVPPELQPHTADLYRMRYETGDSSARTSTPVLLARGVRGLLAPAEADEQDKFGRPEQVTTHNFHTATDVRALGLRVADRVVVQGRNLDVKSIQDHAELGVLQTVKLQERSFVTAAQRQP